MIALVSFGSLGLVLLGMELAERVGWITVNEEAVRWCLIILFVVSFTLWFGFQNPMWKWIW